MMGEAYHDGSDITPVSSVKKDCELILLPIFPSLARDVFNRYVLSAYIPWPLANLSGWKFMAH